MLYRLLKLPFKILRFIWSLFWSLFKLACFGLLIWLVISYFNNSGTPVSQQISSGWNTIVNTVRGSVENSPSTGGFGLSTDSYTPTSSSSETRWATNTASVYIATTDETLVAAYQEAISNWNSTGAFTFTYAANESQADIVCTDYSDSQTQAAGVADTQSNVLTNRISHVNVKLNTYYLLNSYFGYTYERIVNTAEHELGHAIGLEHDDVETSVMQSAGSYYGIQAVDIQRVNSLYNN